MEPTLVQPRSLRLDPDLLGVKQPWAVHDRGLERRGEVVFADAVDPELGRSLPSGVDFRLMFFVVPRRPHPALIGDHRIAMAVPRRAPLEAQPAIARELRAIREARAQYGAAPDPDSLAIQRSMRDQETSVRSELARRFRTSFAQGRIYAYGGERLSTSEVFVGDTPESWADRLVSAVLLRAHPDLPFDHRGFPHPLTDRLVGDVFRGLIQEQPDARTAAEGFGPGLGLSRPAEPGLFDAGECPAIDIVRNELDSNDEAMPAQDMLRQLVDVDGVTPALALLYLLAFIRAHRGELELVPGHRVEARNGDVFQGDRVTWDLAPEVSFSESLPSQLGMLRARPSVTGDTVLPYLELIEGAVGEGLESAGEGTRLRTSLDRLGSAIGNILSALDLLDEGSPRPSVAAREGLARLDELSSAGSVEGFYAVAQARFGGPARLRRALDDYGRLTRLATVAPEIVGSRRYMEAMEFGAGHRELELERDSLVVRLDANSLSVKPGLWNSIQDRTDRLRERFAREYRAHHDRYHHEALTLANRLDDLRPQVEALARFVDVPELGEPVGPDVPQRYEAVAGSFTSGAALGEEVSLDDAPFCATCRLTLAEDVPRHEAEALFGDTKRALREYNRRLGSHAVRRVLADPTRGQIDRFVELVQVADPSALAGVLDDEVVAFLRSFVTSG